MPSFARRIGVVVTLTLTACQGDRTVAVDSPSSIADGPGAGPSQLILPSPPAGSTTSIFVADSVQLVSHVSTKHGRTVNWSSSNSNIVRVTNKGLASALAVGSAIITASNSNGTERWTFNVVNRIASVTVTPNPVTVVVGATAPLTVTLKASDGSVITGPPISYQTLNSTVATVTSAGVVSGVSVGSTTIVVTAGTTGNVVTSNCPTTVNGTTPPPPPPDTGAVGLNAALGRTIFPADNPWNTPSTPPLSIPTRRPSSEHWIDHVVSSGLWREPQRESVRNSVCRRERNASRRERDVRLCRRKWSGTKYPIPPNPPIEAGGDAHPWARRRQGPLDIVRAVCGPALG